MSRRGRGGILISASIAVIGLGAILAYWLLISPAIPLLLPERGARWIGFDEPFSFAPRPPEPVVARIRTQFVVREPLDRALLTVRAYKVASVLLDGRPVGLASSTPEHWKQPIVLDLSRILTVGSHSLEIELQNSNAPAAVLAYCPELQLVTDRNWEASRDGKNWSPARKLSEPPLVTRSRSFPSSAQAITYLSPILISVFVIAFAIHWICPARYGADGFVPFIAPWLWRWCLMATWLVLGCNNYRKIPYWVGYDIEGHMAYVLHLIEHARLPLATDGWQMFQPPIYYLICAPLFKCLSALSNVSHAWLLVRFVSLIAGATHVEMCYRAARSVFPAQLDMQKMATTLGAMLPMNLYISQVMGNESLAGAISATAITIGLGLLNPVGTTIHNGRIALAGTVFGLATITKSTAVLLALPFVLLLAQSTARERRDWRRTISATAILFSAAGLVAGWYYVRNWIELGSPFVGGWQLRGTYAWWQDPGYRTPGQLIRFGEALRYPVYSGVRGFWDSLYSSFWLDGWLSSMSEAGMEPPWNKNWMVAGAWLGLLPGIGILIGVGRTIVGVVVRTVDPALLFAVSCVAIYLAALLGLFLTNPIYSTVKATYTTGIIPCYALLCAKGLEFPPQQRIIRAIVYSGIVVWAVSAYCAYFVW